MKRAKRTLLYTGYGVQMDKLHWVSETRPTHVSIGISDVIAANRHHQFALYGSVKAQGADYARGIRDRGALPCPHVWMAGNEVFVIQAARTVAMLAMEWGAPFIIPNPELAFGGDATPDPKQRPNALERARLIEASRVDHVGLGRLFCDLVHEAWDKAGYTCKILPAVFYWVPAWVRGFMTGASGLIAQMQSFRNPAKPGSLVDAMNPGHRQEQAWTSLARWRKPEDPEWWIFGQQAIYHQNFGVAPEQSAMLACDTYLAGAKGPGEEGLAFWEDLWLDREPWAAKVVASYSPRLDEAPTTSTPEPKPEPETGGGGLWGKLTHFTQEMVQQALLVQLGLYKGAIDGDFAALSTDALQRFQELSWLEPTGVCDPETWGALCMAGGVEATPRAAKAPEGSWPRIPAEVLEDVHLLWETCERYHVSYAPGIGWRLEAQEIPGSARPAWLITMGPRGLNSATYRTMDPVKMPGFVCSTFGNACAVFPLRAGPLFNTYRFGGQPPIWDVLSAPEGPNTKPGFGKFLGFGPYFRHWTSNGDSRQRRSKLAGVGGKDMDLLEVFTRLKETPYDCPEVVIAAWASQARGFYHHVIALILRPVEGEVWILDAGGYKKNGVFSGTDMTIRRITSEAQAAESGKKGWLRAYGMWGGSAMEQLVREQPRLRLGVETKPGHYELVN